MEKQEQKIGRRVLLMSALWKLTGYHAQLPCKSHEKRERKEKRPVRYNNKKNGSIKRVRMTTLI